MLPRPAVTRLLTVPGGDAGVAQTLRIMQGLAIREAPLVARLTALLCDGMTPLQQLEELHEFARDQVANVDDPPGIEWIQSPAVTLANPLGDCDDKCTLLASMLHVVGIRKCFVVSSTHPAMRGAFDHVYLRAEVGGSWLACDPKVPHAPVGWEYREAVRVCNGEEF
jgi:transglutaminase-like putative cysteine protease